MVEKFMGQGTSKEALLEEKLTAEKKLGDVLKAKNDSLLKFNTMKAQVAQTGIGGLELNREIYDKVQNFFDFLEFFEFLIFFIFFQSSRFSHNINYFLLFFFSSFLLFFTHIYTYIYNTHIHINTA